MILRHKYKRAYRYVADNNHVYLLDTPKARIGSILDNWTECILEYEYIRTSLPYTYLKLERIKALQRDTMKPRGRKEWKYAIVLSQIKPIIMASHFPPFCRGFRNITNAQGRGAVKDLLWKKEIAFKNVSFALLHWLARSLSGRVAFFQTSARGYYNMTSSEERQIDAAHDNMRWCKQSQSPADVVSSLLVPR